MRSGQKEGTLDRLVATARRNPEGVLLLAAGAALLMRGVNAARQSMRLDVEDTGEGRRRKGGRLQGALARAGEYASDLTEGIESSVDRAAGYVSEMRSGAMSVSGDLLDDARGTMRRGVNTMLEEQPLAMALLGFAAGAVVAGSIPTSTMEADALRPVGKRIAKPAREMGKRVRAAANNARRKLAEVADERGLNAEGIKDAARDVADAFTDGIAESGDDRNADRSAPQSRAGVTETESVRPAGSRGGSGGE